jgi:hypothetical protein
MIHLVNVSNWRIEGLIFEGKRAGGDGTRTPRSALLVEALDVDVTGIVFRHNQVQNWALGKDPRLPIGMALAFQGSQGRKKFVRDSLITENVVKNVRGFGIYISHARNAIISQNDISKLLCKTETSPQGAILNPKVAGIKEKNITTTLDDPSADSMENVFEANVIHDFPDNWTCAEESGWTASEAWVFGYWCDVGAKSGLVRRNKIYNLGYLPESELYGARGISFESRCHGYTAEGNEISQIGGPGIEIRNANDAKIVHNTIYDTRWFGVHLKDGTRAVIMDNIFSNIRVSGVHIRSAAWQEGDHIIDYNLYDQVGRWGTIDGVIVPRTFVGWQQACQCEANGRTGDLFVNPAKRDFTLLPWSPASGASSTGTDMGAFE